MDYPDPSALVMDNCTARKLGHGPLGAPFLDFPKPPPITRDMITPRLDLHDSIYHFTYLRQFLAYVQPNPFPIELFRDFMQDRIPTTTFMAKVLEVEVGLVLCVLVLGGLGCAAPGLAASRLCSRPRPEPQPHPCLRSCKRRSLVFFMELLLAFLLLGVVGMLATNQQISTSVMRIEPLSDAVLEDTLAFLSDSQARIQQLVTGSLDRAVLVATSDLDNVENLLGRPIQAELARETGIDVALENLIDIEREAREVWSSAEGVVAEGSEAAGATEAARERLWEIRHQIESTLRHCQAKDRPLCDTITLQGLDLRFTTKPITTDQALQFLRSQNVNLTTSIMEASVVYQNLPVTIEKETKEARQGVSRQLTRHKMQVGESVRGLELWSREVSHRLQVVRESLSPHLASLHTVDFWLWLVGLSAGLAVLQVWILLVGAIGCGCCGAEKSSVPTIILGLVVSSTVSGLVWAVGAVALVGGCQGEASLCRPLGPPLSALPQGLFYPRGHILSNFLHDNSSLHMPLGVVLESCKQNKSLYGTMRLGQVVDVEAAGGRWAPVRERLDQVSLDLLQVQILSPTLHQGLRDLYQGLSVNLTNLRTQLSGPVTLKDVDSLAGQLESVGSQLGDLGLATHLATLAARCRRVITTHLDPLEQHKERLMYQLTALELKMGPLQKQVNQSMAHLKTIQYFINNQWGAIAQQNVREYTRRVMYYLEQFKSHVGETLDSGAINCYPVWYLFQSTRILLCSHIVDPLNGFWFATLWCLIIILILTPVCIKLIDYYKSKTRFQGEMSPSEMFLAEEQTSGWSTPGSSDSRQREGDGW